MLLTHTDRLVTVVTHDHCRAIRIHDDGRAPLLEALAHLKNHLALLFNKETLQ
jgi:hypothetical protein